MHHKKCLPPYLDDSGENQLWEANAVGLAMEIFQYQVIELVNEPVLSRRNRNQETGYDLNPTAFLQQPIPMDFPQWERLLQPLGTETQSTFTHPEGLFLQVGIGELQDHSEVDGLGTHPAWLLVEIHLLENLGEKKKNLKRV